MTTHYEIIVGTMLGASEYVAEAIAKTLEQQGNTFTIHLEPTLSDVNKDSTWIVCTSTHGAGELPDNIQPFAKSLKGADLNGVNFYVIGLGDTSYDTFCHGAKEIETTMKNTGATLLAAPIHIDVLEHPIPEDEAVARFESTLETA
ncbi:FMN-binding protein MioC [Alteromonas stellipolaris]|uniref:FMN-binding protein MioC n=1 Tax=Alteromonas stellipolaris TaxID=233316 RepID=UPI00211972BA|nr:FMN-binding protein MioC [Alteromonas stellipolaris]MCQ8848544.1 FMN-binding protein MioC [Alteromonas stellipolaris]